MPSLSRPALLLLLVGTGFLAAFPLWGDTFYIRFVTRIMIYALFAMSLDLLVGYVGLVSLGHAAFFGVAIYAVAGLVNKAGITDAAVLLPAALAVAALCSLVIGWISIRTSGVYFIMITLALAQMLYYFFNDQKYWGGTDGMNISSRPTLTMGDTVLFNFNDRVQFYYLALACLVAAFLLLYRLLRSPFGHALVGIRANEGRMRALGYDVQRLKLIAFVVAGTIAGLAGFLEASRGTFASPAHLGWHELGHTLVLVILGGIGTLFGPVIGAFVLMLAEDYFATLTDRWLLIMGVFVIAVVMFLPNGLAGLLKVWSAAMVEPVLETSGLSRLFGGLAAVQDVALSVLPGEVHAVVGPNGAGKTTLINLLSGDLPPSGGRVRYDGQDITGWPAHRVARVGIGRSYQKTNIFREFTAFENCWLAAKARMTRPPLFRLATSYRETIDRAERALALCALEHRRNARAGAMSYGEQRQLELAMMLATEPRLLLLDEPLAGMGPEESQRVIELLRRLAADHTMVMIEHDMDAVFAIAHRITVMVNGSVLATGTPDAIRANRQVQQAYLGEDA